MRLSSATTKAAVVAGATALAAGIAPPAQAHWDDPSPFQAATLDMRGLVDADVYHAILDRKLDVVQAEVTALTAKVSAVPSTTVLTGQARLAAKARLAKVVLLQRLLAAIPATGPYAATAAERAQIDALLGDLATVKSALLTLLANEPITPTAVRPALRTVSVAKATVDARRTRWWGWWTWVDRDRRWDGSWDGWDGHRCDRH